MSQTWGPQHFEGTFSLSKKGHFLKIKRTLVCLLQNLGGYVLPVPPGSYVYGLRAIFKTEIRPTLMRKFCLVKSLII